MIIHSPNFDRSTATILIALRGVVYDVTEGRAFYGKNGRTECLPVAIALARSRRCRLKKSTLLAMNPDLNEMRSISCKSGWRPSRENTIAWVL